MRKTVNSGQWTVGSVEGSGFRVQGSEESGRWSVVSGRFLRSSTNDQRPTTLCPPPTAHCPLRIRRGLSLLEVLVSIFVLAVGLLSVLAIIPLGQFAISESSKSDYSGMCGRAAMREIKVRGMCDYRYWFFLQGSGSNPGNWGLGEDSSGAINFIPDIFNNVYNSLDSSSNYCNDFMPFFVDPLGYSKGLRPDFVHPNANFNFSGHEQFVFARRTLSLAPVPVTGTRLPITNNLAEAIFVWPDDLVFDIPKNSTERPTLTAASVKNEGNYSWFFTVSPAGSELALPVSQRRKYTVSAAICYKRNFVVKASLPEGERTVRLSTTNPYPGMGIGGGAMVLEEPVAVKNKDWVLLVRRDAYGYPRKCSWYRVVNQAMDNTIPGPMITLAGPDWDINMPNPPYNSNTHPDILIVIDGVIGVYTTTVNINGN